MSAEDAIVYVRVDMLIGRGFSATKSIGFATWRSVGLSVPQSTVQWKSTENILQGHRDIGHRRTLGMATQHAL